MFLGGRRKQARLGGEEAREADEDDLDDGLQSEEGEVGVRERRVFFSEREREHQCGRRGSEHHK